MKKFFALSFVLVGCVNQANVPVETPSNSNEVSKDSNHLQKAKKLFSGGVRFAYNKSKNAYEWVTSEEAQEKANQIIDQAKEAQDKASELFDQAKSEIQELTK